MKFLKGIVDSEVAGENLLEAQLKIYAKTRAACPGDDPHIHLAKVYMSRLRARRVDVSDMSIMNKCFSEMVFPACLDEGFNIRAAAIIIMKDERPDIIANFPKFEWQLENFLSPLFERLEHGERLLNIYNEKNPAGQISREFPPGFCALQAIDEQLQISQREAQERSHQEVYESAEREVQELAEQKDKERAEQKAQELAEDKSEDGPEWFSEEQQLENFPQAMMVLEYRPEAETAWLRVQTLPEEFQLRFLGDMDADPTTDPLALVEDLEFEHLKLMRPFADDAANDALEDIRTIGDDAEEEFKKAYGLFSTTLSLSEIVHRIEAKHGPTEKTLAEQEAKERAEREAKERTEREAKERAEQEAKERAEREAKERTEREAKERAEQEAKEHAEQEAKEHAEREAKERTNNIYRFLTVLFGNPFNLTLILLLALYSCSAM